MSRRTRFNSVLAITFAVCAFLLASLGLAAAGRVPLPLTVSPPVVTKISPMFGPTGGGTVVTITGSNFTGVTGVAFGASAGTSVVCATANQCTATSPAGSGTVSVRVTSASGTSADTAADDFTYTAPATVCTTFSAAANFGVGLDPLSVAVADFNGDGISDLAVANFNSHNVSILLGTGTGTFSAATNFTVGTSPRSVVIGDFNGDGKSDLAVANIASNDVSILLGTGTGTFSAATNFTAGSFPTSVAVGDFNGDGKSDLALSNFGSPTVSILIGTGTGTFGAATNFTAGTSPVSVAIRDFNGDGRSDLAVANQNSNNVSILLNAFCPPTVTAISPPTGPNTGGTVVTITGTNFVVGATTVAFGGSAGTSVSCASITQCTATSPAGSGAVDVRVTTAGGTSATSASDQFTYFVPVPTLGAFAKMLLAVTAAMIGLFLMKKE